MDLVVSILILFFMVSCKQVERAHDKMGLGGLEAERRGDSNSFDRRGKERNLELYDSVVIGDQVWLAMNLDVEYFRNGDRIPQAITAEEWEQAAESRSPAWCYYNNDTLLGKRYGKLYNHYAVSDPRGLAPEGWRIPTKADWEKLERHIGGFFGGSIKLMEIEGESLANSTGFGALPGGGRFREGGFEGIGKEAFFACMDTVPKMKDEAYVVWLTFEDKGNFSNIWSLPRGHGFSVRCIREGRSTVTVIPKCSLGFVREGR